MNLAEPYARVWDAFQSAGSTADGRHDTAEWRAHEGLYAACIIRVDATALQPGLAQLRGELAQLDGVRLHPEHFFHIMLQELGFVSEEPRRSDEITPARLEEFAQSAIEPISNQSPFTLSLGGANAFQDAIFLEVSGGQKLSRMHERLFELAAILRVPEYPFLPHCTIAHFAGEIPTSVPADLLRSWRAVRFGEIPVTEIEIVTLSPREAYPELVPYAVLPLRS